MMAGVGLHGIGISWVRYVGIVVLVSVSFRLPDRNPLGSSSTCLYPAAIMPASASG